MDRNEEGRAAFYSSPAVTPEEHPGFEEDLSDDPHKQSCVTVPPSATWARDPGRVCGFSKPTQCASETPELVCPSHGPVCSTVLGLGAHRCGSVPGLPAHTSSVERQGSSCAAGQAASMPCRDHKGLVWPKGPAQGSPGSLQQSKGPSCV